MVANQTLTKNKEYQPIDDLDGTRYCNHCKTRHLISDFAENQTICKQGRKERLTQFTSTSQAIKLPHNYEKHCKKCDRTLLASKHFGIDKSRPDGYFLYCKDCSAEYTQGKKKTTVIYLSDVANEFRKKLMTTVLQVPTDQERSVVRQLVEEFQHEGNDISFVGREWQIQILNDMWPNIAIRKPSQKGVTWILERFVFCLLLKYIRRPFSYFDNLGNRRTKFLTGIYSFETEKKASQWSKVRLEAVKADNVAIRDAIKMGGTDSALLMKLGRTSLYLVGRTTVSGVTSVDADFVIIDEKDRDEKPQIANQIGSRLLESPFMNTTTSKGLLRTTSTPEVSGTGISLLMENSCYYEWEIFCIECETWQVLTYPKCIGNFYEKGEEPIKDKTGRELEPYWRCMYCYKPIDWSTIGNWDSKDPDYYTNCRWVMRNPEKINTKTGKGIVGYQVPFADSQRTAPFFLAERDDPERDINYLYNHLLGLPYDDITKTLMPGNFHRVADIGWGFNGNKKYVLGCDHHPAHGGFVVIMLQTQLPKAGITPTGKWCVIYFEHIKNNRELWDTIIETNDGQEVIKKGRLYDLLMEYNISVAMIDNEPDTNEVNKLKDEFGLTRKVWSNKSGMYQDAFKIIEEEEKDGQAIPICKVIEDKVSAIDWYYNMIRFGTITYLDNDKMPTKFVQEYMPAHMNLYKGETFSKTRLGVSYDKLAAENIREIYKKKQKSIKDHWVMAGKFAAQATRVLTEVNLSVKSMAPPTIKGMSRIPGM
jgi:hypothetical protein